MGHTVQLVEEGVTAINLHSAAGTIHVLRYKIETPSRRTSGQNTSRRDGGETGVVSYDNVTEAMDLLITGASPSTARGLVNDIEEMLEKARRRQSNSRIKRIFVQVQWDAESVAFRSEILEGALSLGELVLDQMLGAKLEATLYFTRRYFWEEEDETEIALGDSLTTGGYAITNHNDSGHANTIKIFPAYVEGVLPAACRFVLRNEAGATVSYRNIYIGHNIHSSPNSFAHVLEGEDNETAGGTVSGSDNGSHTFSDNQVTLVDNTKSWSTNQWIGYTVRNVTDGSSGTITANTATNVTATLAGGTDDDWDTGDLYAIDDTTNFSGGYYYSRSWTGALSSTALYTFTLPGTLLEYANGAYFRLLAKFALSPNTTTYVRVGLYYQSLLKLYETPEVKLSSTLQLQDLGAIQLPPALSGLSGLDDIVLTITARDTVSGSLSIDFIQMTPLDSWRHIKALGGNYSDATEIVDDGMSGQLYANLAGTDIAPVLVAKGDPILLWPAKYQWFYVLFDEASDMDVGRASEVEIYYRPRRLSI